MDSGIVDSFSGWFTEDEIEGAIHATRTMDGVLDKIAEILVEKFLALHDEGRRPHAIWGSNSGGWDDSETPVSDNGG